MRSRRRFEMALDRLGNAAPSLRDCASSVAAAIWTRDTIRALIQERHQPSACAHGHDTHRGESARWRTCDRYHRAQPTRRIRRSTKRWPRIGPTCAIRSRIGQADKALERPDPTAAQRAFREARTAFKRVELFVEYYGQFAAREVNGPPLFRAEDEDPENPLAPAGLQVIEADLFPVD